MQTFKCFSNFVPCWAGLEHDLEMRDENAENYLWSIFGKYFVNILSIFGQYLVHIWPVFGQYWANIWSIFGQYLVNI